MLKLKIGQNYLLVSPITGNQETFALYAEHIAWVMCQTNQVNKIYSPCDINTSKLAIFYNYIKTNQINEVIFIWSNLNAFSLRYASESIRREGKRQRKTFKFVKMEQTMRTNTFKVAMKLAQKLYELPDSILSSLHTASLVKEAQTYLEISDTNIKNLAIKKEVLSKQKIADLDVPSDNLLKELNVQDIRSDSKGLILTLGEIRVNPSDDLGKAISSKAYRDDPLFTNLMVNYYCGGYFYVPPCEILIKTDFNITFLGFKDRIWNEYFRRTTLFNGFPHLGLGGKCYGEFASVIAGARTHGLTYYFIGLINFLSCANIFDPAGICIFRYPMKTADGQKGPWYLIDKFETIAKHHKWNLDVGGNTHLECLYKFYDSNVEDYVQTRRFLDECDVVRNNSRSHGSGSDDDSFLKFCREDRPDLMEVINNYRKGLE